jgi:hypothetical protein
MAGLPPNLNNPTLSAANAALQNAAANASTNNSASVDTFNDSKPKLTLPGAIRNTFNITEMFMALPLLANSFVLQADNIAAQVKPELVKDPGAAGYLGDSFSTISGVFKKIIDKFIAGGKTANNIESNRSANLTQNFLKRILHPNITKEFTSLLFNTRRIVFNLFPNTFTVPSVGHDPLNPDSTKDVAGRATANFFSLMAYVTRPLTALTSLFAAATTVPSHLMGSYFTYTGNQKGYDATKYFNRISEIFTPLLSNLSSLLSVSKSYIDSFVGRKNGQKESLFVTRGRYHVNWTNMIQGIFGSVTSIPYFLGIFGKLRDVVQEKDTDQDYKFSKNLKVLAENIFPKLEPWIKKINPNYDVDITLDNLKEKTEKRIAGTEKLIKNFLHSLFNSSTLMKNIFSHVRPSDGVGNIQGLADSHTVDSGDRRDYSFAYIKKDTFFREIFDWLHPIQSMLMLLPNSLVSSSDPYILDNSKTLGRRFDRLFGFNSMLLSFPNYVIYGLSTRVPQMILKYCEYVDRKSSFGKSEKANPAGKSGFDSYQKIIATLRKLPIPGTAFLASKLEGLGITESTFKDDGAFREIFDALDTSARKQEASVKASELVGATRIGFRTLLERRNGLFFAKRDQSGLTDEERSRQGFYQSVGKFKDIVGKIPVVGWVASPVIEAFRGFYKTDTSNRRNVIRNNIGENLAQVQNQAAATGVAA